jgi:hypothetical protein
MGIEMCLGLIFVYFHKEKYSNYSNVCIYERLNRLYVHEASVYLQAQFIHHGYWFLNRCKNAYIKARKPHGFHRAVTVVKIVSRSFSSAEIQHFRTENTWSDYNWRILMIFIWFPGTNYYKLAVEKDRVSIFTTVTTIWKPGF